MKNRNKFRGKCAFCGTWYYGGVYGESFIVNVSEEDVFKSFKYCKENTIGRLLGEDYAGNEVYEGDVVELKIENDDVAEPYVYERWEIYFDEKCWRYHFRNKEKIYDSENINFEQMVKDFQIRVIGNVFDNPELLDEPISEVAYERD